MRFDERAQVVGELAHRPRGLAQHRLGVLPDLAARDHLARPGAGLALELLLAAAPAVGVIVRVVVIVVVLVRRVVVVLMLGGRHRSAS